MSTAPLALAPGTCVESLRVDRVLGHGAFGITYLVTDTVLDSSFALKEFVPADLVLREGATLRPVDEGARAHFEAGLRHFLDEGRTVAGLEHRNVVKVFRCFEANGTAYLLMPYYQGEALHTLLKRGGTLTQDEALALAGPLLDALAYLHGRAVIHQDVKPANVYITREGTPILLDFGAAGQRLDAGAATRRLLGSEGYAAPEQGEPGGAVGPWTDVYGLAATLYRCVTGHIPPAAGQRQAAVARGEPDPLQAVKGLVPAGAYGTVAPAIERGLALRPADRPRSVAEWRAAFEPAGTGPEERERLPQVLLAAFILVLVSAIAWLFLFDRSGPEQAPGVSAIPDAPMAQAASPEEVARWQAALEADTVFGYRLFLSDFPASIHRDQANEHLARLDHQAWGRADAEGTRSAVDAYLEEFPEGLHLADARIRLNAFDEAERAEQRLQAERERQERAAWEAARARRTVEAIDEFLGQWPAGPFGDEARALRQTLQGSADDRRAFDAAANVGRIESYRAYLEAFPRGAHVAAALEAIDRLTLRPGKVFTDCDGCPRMTVVPAGSFWQGSDETAPGAVRQETPQRLVTIARPFAVGVHEVTLEQWDRCVADGGCATRPGDNGWGRGQRPAIMVSWNDAVEFTEWLSGVTGQAYSLPSESEWEYVARAGQEGDWLGGDAAGVCRYANIAGSESGLRWQHADCADPAALETLPVGSLEPNAFGLYDVIGNVSEWTLDCMNLSYLDAPADGSAWGRGICSSRMTRGGSWFTGAREIRLPARFNLKNGDRNDFTGFRVVRRIDDP